MDYYTSVMVITWCTLLILSILVWENDRLSKQQKKIYWQTYAIVALAGLSEWLGVRLNGNAAFPPILLRIIKCCDYILTPMAGGRLIFQIPKRSRISSAINVVLMFNTFLQVVLFVTGRNIVIDDRNRYAMGPYYSLYVVVYIILIVLIMAELVRYGRIFRRQNIASLCGILLLVGGGILLEEVMEGEIRTIYLALSIGMSLLFIHTTEYMQIVKDDDVSALRRKIALNQIQPHFLYNSLSVIREIYRGDVQKGETALNNFADYMRRNMDAMTSRDMIRFSEELEHVNKYLYLQQLRFGDELQVEFDLKSQEFFLPTLTLQPLVENAITYGIRKRRDHSGIVRICTRETEDAYELIVTDNGPGFETEKMQESKERSHVGLENIRQRLEMVCSGRLEIRSESDQGTQVRVIIPKKEYA